MKVQVFYQSEALLGEGPVWNSQTEELLWVDIENAELHFFHPASNNYQKHSFDNRLSAAAPTRKGPYLLALQKGLAMYNPSTNELEYFSQPEKSIPHNRFNDGKCDPQGRFWIGSMDCQAASGQGSLYRVEKNLEVNRILSDLSIPNGLAWNKDLHKMYFIDTARYQVLQFDYTPQTGHISNPKAVIYIPKSQGAPDGMTIDRDGMLWIAHWGGANVSRWNPHTGQPIQKVQLPAPHVTSCCFGGKNFDQLFITTARYGLSDQQLKEFPLSGAVFVCTPKVGGGETSFFQLR